MALERKVRTYSLPLQYCASLSSSSVHPASWLCQEFGCETRVNPDEDTDNKDNETGNEDEFFASGEFFE